MAGTSKIKGNAKTFVPPKPATAAELRRRWKKKQGQVQMLAHNMQKLRYNITSDMKSDDEKVFLTACVVSLMDKSAERVGNDDSASKGHRGITGLLKSQVKIEGNSIHLRYTGKSGVKQEKVVTDERLSNALRKAMKLSKSKYLFCTGDGFKIKNDRVNRYLSDFGITAKDIRGFSANKWLIQKLHANNIAEDEKQRKKDFIRMSKAVAVKVGHGHTMLKNQYLIPGLEEEYITNGRIMDIKDIDGFKGGGSVKKMESGGELSGNGKETQTKQQDIVIFLEQLPKDKKFLKYAKLEHVSNLTREHLIAGSCEKVAKYVKKNYPQAKILVAHSTQSGEHQFIELEDKYYDGYNYGGVKDYIDLHLFKKLNLSEQEIKKVRDSVYERKEQGGVVDFMDKLKGEKLTLLHNTEKAPYLGKRFGQDVEPAGYYAIEQYKDFGDRLPTIEVAEFKAINPLIIPVNGNALVSWKYDLSKKQKAKGKKLSDKLIAAGYDCIITVYENGDTGEIIVLDTSKLIMKKHESGGVIVDSDNFKKWFASSKAVDENGQPAKVYHGTESDPFYTYDKTTVRDKFGFFFTDDKDYAEMFGRAHVPYYLSIQKPYVITQEKWDAIRDAHAKDAIWFENWRNQLIGKGHDGLIVKFSFISFAGTQIRNPEIYAVFESNQIKIADGSNTTFDANSPDVRYEDGGITIAEESDDDEQPESTIDMLKRYVEVSRNFDAFIRYIAISNEQEQQDIMDELKLQKATTSEIGQANKKKLETFYKERKREINARRKERKLQVEQIKEQDFLEKITNMALESESEMQQQLRDYEERKKNAVRIPVTLFEDLPGREDFNQNHQVPTDLFGNVITTGSNY